MQPEIARIVQEKTEKFPKYNLAGADECWLLICAGGKSSSSRAGLSETRLAAFDEEVLLIQQQLKNIDEKKIEGIKFVQGDLHNRRVVVAWTGTGKVNSAATTTLLIHTCISGTGRYPYTFSSGDWRRGFCFLQRSSP